MIATLNLWGYISITLAVIAWSLILVSEIIDLVIRKNLKTEAEGWQERAYSWAFMIILPLFLIVLFSGFSKLILLEIVLILIFAIVRLWLMIERVKCLNRIISNLKKMIDYYKEVRR